MSLNEFKDELSRITMGMTKAEAVAQGICVKCRKPAEPRIHTPLGVKEYRISGMCEECFDELFKEED